MHLSIYFLSLVQVHPFLKFWSTLFFCSSCPIRHCVESETRMKPPITSFKWRNPFSFSKSDKHFKEGFMWTQSISLALGKVHNLVPPLHLVCLFYSSFSIVHTQFIVSTSFHCLNLISINFCQDSCQALHISRGLLNRLKNLKSPLSPWEAQKDTSRLRQRYLKLGRAEDKDPKALTVTMFHNLPWRSQQYCN